MTLDLRTYFRLLWKTAMFATTNARPSGYISFFLYFGLFLYGIVQSFETATMLRTIRDDLSKKLESLRTFVATSQELIKSISTEDIVAWSDNYNPRKEVVIAPGLSGLYKTLTNVKTQALILSLMRGIYAIDVANSIRKLLRPGVTTLVNYTNDVETQFWNMGHVVLPDTQVRNPVSLRRSLIITGPNAGGKTTYVRAICTNYILSQTFGIACAARAEVNPVHAIGSFMRISDELGHLSLFEAETKRCADLIQQATEIMTAGKRAIYFMDEPMHSTPPIEGSATSIAVIEHIGQMTGVRLLVTTHYHDLISLAKDFPDKFINISVEAYEEKDVTTDVVKWKFPYEIRRGASYQCIALELLKENELPDIVIARAIKMKNKLCSMKISK